MKFYNQTEYSKHTGLSQQRISQLIKGGFLKGALKKFGKRQLIDPEKADLLLDENIDQLRRKQPPVRPTTAEIEATHWNADQPDLGHYFLESLRYLCKLAEIDPAAVKIIQPDNNQEGTIIRFNEFDGDVCPVTWCLCSILEDPDDLIEHDQEYGVPDWAFQMHEEVRERLR